MCTRARDWRWSSYAVLVNGWRWPPFLEAGGVLRLLGESEDRALRRLEALVEDDLVGDLLS